MALLQETQPLAHFRCTDSVIFIVPVLCSFIQPILHPIMASRTNSHLHLLGPSYQPWGFYSIYNLGDWGLLFLEDFHTAHLRCLSSTNSLFNSTVSLPSFLIKRKSDLSRSVFLPSPSPTVDDDSNRKRHINTWRTWWNGVTSELTVPEMVPCLCSPTSHKQKRSTFCHMYCESNMLKTVFLFFL